MGIGAYVLIRIYPNRVNEVIQTIRKLKQIKKAEAITGPYDGIAYIESENIKELGRVILAEIQNLEGVRDTTTCLVVDL